MGGTTFVLRVELFAELTPLLTWLAEFGGARSSRHSLWSYAALCAASASR